MEKEKSYDYYIGKRIRELREDKGMTQNELSKALPLKNASPAWVSSVENGATCLKAREVLSLAIALSSNVNYIVTGKQMYSQSLKTRTAKEHAREIVQNKDDAYCMELIKELAEEERKKLSDSNNQSKGEIFR